MALVAAIATTGMYSIEGQGSWWLTDVHASLGFANVAARREEGLLGHAMELRRTGKALFEVSWVHSNGAGRPLKKGTGRTLTGPAAMLIGFRAANRVSAPDANSCAGCHNTPYGISGGSGDFAADVFVLGQRFDFITFDPTDTLPTRGTVDETGEAATLHDAGNLRASTGMFGAGYLEMLSRQMTEELQRTRDTIRYGESKALVAKGVTFGTLTLRKDGVWDTSKVAGLGRVSLVSSGTTSPPTLVIRPWHQASNVVSLREFTNTAFNHHHGIQTTERFGVDTDPDGDGVRNEMTRDDVTAVTIWQATLQVPGRVIPRDPAIEQAVLRGEQAFDRVGCATCHVPRLPLDRQGWVFVEPNPYNPPGNLRTGEAPDVKVDLSSDDLPLPRLKPEPSGTVWVDAYTDFKLHNICGSGEGEPLDQNAAQWSERLMDGNCRFLTKRLWGAANEPPFFHHGLFTTLRSAVLAHSGEALASRLAFEALPKQDQDGLIEFLKTLQVLPSGTKDRIVDENYQPRTWPPQARSDATPTVRLKPDTTSQSAAIGRERAVPQHLERGAEFKLSIASVIEFGKKLFTANWTDQDGVGRPLTKGNGKPLSDAAQRLDGRQAFNRISGPDANSCQGCHNAPFGIAGGGGDYVTLGFEGAQRFDFVTFDRRDTMPTRGSLDEARRPATLQTVGNARATPGLLGAGYLEMLARQMTSELQASRDAIQPGQSKPLGATGVSFGVLARRPDGTWDTKRVEGLARQSLAVTSPAGRPSLVIRPWHQSGSVASLREFTNTAFNRHHGIQTTERFGVNTDPDGDSVKNEMTRGDVTAVAMFLATLPVPGRVISDDPAVERAVLTGERLFDEIRCTACHIPSLPLERHAWTYSEPGPFNPAGNLQRTAARVLNVDLISAALPLPRLVPSRHNPNVIDVPAYTDFKLHDITDAADPDAQEPINMNEPEGSRAYLAGNRKFITRRLWGAANEPPYFHHGLFTDLRQAVVAHAGEALDQRRAFERLTRNEQDAVLEFLKTLQVLPPGTRDRIVNQHYRPRAWPPQGQALTGVLSENTR